MDDAPDDAYEFTSTFNESEIIIDAIYDFSVICTYEFEGEKLILTIPYNPDKPHRCVLV